MVSRQHEFHKQGAAAEGRAPGRKRPTIQSYLALSLPAGVNAPLLSLS